MHTVKRANLEQQMYLVINGSSVCSYIVLLDIVEILIILWSTLLQVIR